MYDSVLDLASLLTSNAPYDAYAQQRGLFANAAQRIFEGDSGDNYQL